MMTSYVDALKGLCIIWKERMSDSVSYAPIMSERRKAFSYWRHMYEQAAYDFLVIMDPDNEEDYRFIVAEFGDEIVFALADRYKFLEECGRTEAI